MGQEDEIRLIAYAIWEKEGCMDGHDCEHWFKAEAIWGQNRKEKAAAKNTTMGPQISQKTAKGTVVKKKSHK